MSEYYWFTPILWYLHTEFLPAWRFMCNFHCFLHINATIWELMCKFARQSRQLFWRSVSEQFRSVFFQLWFFPDWKNDFLCRLRIFIPCSKRVFRNCSQKTETAVPDSLSVYDDKMSVIVPDQDLPSGSFQEDTDFVIRINTFIQNIIYGHTAMNHLPENRMILFQTSIIHWWHKQHYFFFCMIQVRNQSFFLENLDKYSKLFSIFS